MKMKDIEVGRLYAAAHTKSDVLKRRCVEVVETGIHGQCDGWSTTFRSDKPLFVRVKQVDVEGFPTDRIASYSNRHGDGTQSILGRMVIGPWEETELLGRKMLETRARHAEANDAVKRTTGYLAELIALHLGDAGIKVKIFEGPGPSAKVEVSGTEDLGKLRALLGAKSAYTTDELPEELQKALAEHREKGYVSGLGLDGMSAARRLKRLGLVEE